MSKYRIVETITFVHMIDAESKDDALEQIGTVSLNDATVLEQETISINEIESVSA